MHVTTTLDGSIVYQQVVASDPKVVNATVGFLMQQLQGTKFVTVVSNNGNDLTFRNENLDVGQLVRRVNSIATRTPGGAT